MRDFCRHFEIEYNEELLCLYEQALEDHKKYGDKIFEFEHLGVFTNMLESVKEIRNELKKDERNALYCYFLYRVIQKYKSRVLRSVCWPRKREESVYFDTLPLFTLLWAVPKMLEKHKEMGVPADVTRSTLDMFENQIGDFINLFGHFGIAKYMDWMREFITCKILRIGRFNFEIEEAWDFAVFRRENEICLMLRETNIHKSGRVLGSADCEDVEGSFFADIVETDEYFEGYPVINGLCSNEKIRLCKSEWKKQVDNGDLVISVHIPSGEPLDHDKNTADFRRAAKIFTRIYGNIPAFYCSSWMLDKDIEGIMGKKTSLTRFGDRFIRFPSKSKGKSVFKYLYKTVNTDDLDALPENTSMQRAVKAHLKGGGYIYGAQGIILIDDTYI